MPRWVGGGGHGALRANGRNRPGQGAWGKLPAGAVQKWFSCRHSPFIPSVFKGLAHLFLNPPLHWSSQQKSKAEALVPVLQTGTVGQEGARAGCLGTAASGVLCHRPCCQASLCLFSSAAFQMMFYILSLMRRGCDHQPLSSGETLSHRNQILQQAAGGVCGLLYILSATRLDALRDGTLAAS